MYQVSELRFYIFSIVWRTIYIYIPKNLELVILPEILLAPPVQLERMIGILMLDLASHVLGDGVGISEHGVEHQQLRRAVRSLLQTKDGQRVTYGEKSEMLSC